MRVALLANFLSAALLLEEAVRREALSPVVLLTAFASTADEGELAERRQEQQALLAQSTLPAQALASEAELCEALERLRPDLLLCWGFPWRVSKEALALPPLGVLNVHPSRLPRYRGPIPVAWAFRNGDSEIGVSVHRMDGGFDSGHLLAQSSFPVSDKDASMARIQSRIGVLGSQLLARALPRALARERGEEQQGAPSAAGPFDDDYAYVDWQRSARDIHNQTRAWMFSYGLCRGVRGPVAEIDGELVRLLRSSLTEPRRPCPYINCSDGPLWILDQEPFTGEAAR